MTDTTTLSKYYPLNAITDIFEPRYNDETVLIAEDKIKRSPLDIKLRFSKVNDTSDYSGDWYIKRKDAVKYRRKVNNNGKLCLVIPFSEFKKLKLVDREYI